MALTLETISVCGYEDVFWVTDPSVGLRALIALHNTTLGPALGGVRMHPYAHFDDALEDVLRLAKGMTYKSALAMSGTGGGKSVIIGDPKTDKSDALLKSFGQAVDQLQGRYICAEDVGITTKDVAVISESTKYVTGLVSETSSGDPSPYTAWGTLRGIQASLQAVEESDDLNGVRIAIQGLGAVGMLLAELLFWRGARLIVADPDTHKTRRVATLFDAQVVPTEAIHREPCDIFAPCALGGGINDRTVPELNCRIVAGCANNQLQRDAHALRLKSRGILYAPDFVINAGGLINVVHELRPGGYAPCEARQKVDALALQLSAIFDIAAKSHISTAEAAISLADYRLKYGLGKRSEAPHFHHAGALV